MSEVSKIENIIKASIDEETQRSTAQLKEQINSLMEQAIERINNVYGSAISTLRKLELTDVTIFEFFQKTDGNVRVYEFDTTFPDSLKLYIGTTEISDYESAIRLKERTKYKIILIAIKQEEVQNINKEAGATRCYYL